MGLSTKGFKSSGGDSDLSFKDLEVNPNYKPEGAEAEAAAKAVEEAAAEEARLAAEALENENKGAPEGGSDDNKGEPSGEPTGKPDSSLNNDEPKGDDKPEISDEDYLKVLSEKLGREISSFDDLTKVNENPLDKDPYLKSLSDWREKTGRPLEDWIKFQKDYTEMDNIDVAREFLQIKYPTLSESNIELELKQYIASDDDLEYEVDMKNLQLEKLAIEGREKLGELKSTLELPDASRLTPEIQNKLKFVEQIRKDLKTSEDEQNVYDTKISESSAALDILELNLGGDTKLEFKVSEEDKQGMPQMISSMPRWKNEDGSWNHKAVVEDGVRLKNFDKMLQLAYEQGVNSGTDGVIRDAKNSTLGDRANESQQGNKQKGDIIEGGIDSLLDKKTLKVRFN